jgi:hypothetical protein
MASRCRACVSLQWRTLPLPKDPLSMSLFEPLIQRSLALRNRIVVSPMCQYSSVEGLPDDCTWCIWAAAPSAGRRW